ncbi:MAG: DUF3048 domain-containing protein [Anaerolineales bacterium]
MPRYRNQTPDPQPLARWAALLAAVLLLGSQGCEKIPIPAAAAGANPESATAPAQALPQAAASPSAAPAPSAFASPAPSPSAAPSPAPPQAIDPLTGLPVSDRSVLQRRMVAVKVSNYPRTARPQAGLSYADLLFEFYQEDGETRFHALYLSQDVSKVGPIRSGRIVDGLLEKMYQSILVFNGADSRVVDLLSLRATLPMSLMESPTRAPCPALCRDPSQALHINSLYGNTAALRKAAVADGISNLTPDLGGMAFSPTTPAGGEPATDVLVRFLTDQARAEWRFDPSTDKYFRWSETDSGGMAPLTDRLTGQQLSVSNLIVVLVPFDRHVVQPKATEMYDIALDGVGQAMFFRDGQEWDGYWRVVANNRPLQFFGPNGAFPLHPGVSWIALVGADSVAVDNAPSWRIEDHLP